MKVIINDSRKIFTIQEEFNAAFPYLKLEFFSQPYLKGGEPTRKIRKRSCETLGECRSIHKQGEVIITDTTTVAELEHSFSDIYSLEIQVLRKSGTAWLETTITNAWTLTEQNKQGEALSKEIF